VNGDACALERHDVERRRVIDDTELALRPDQFDDRGVRLVRIGGAKYETGGGETARGHFFDERLAVIQDMMSAQGPNSVTCSPGMYPF
jgi:hypothetical protein